MMAMLAKHYLDAGERVILLTNRRMLLEQSSRVFGGYELEHGIVAAGMENQGYLPFQIASIQTLTSRMTRASDERPYQLPAAKCVLVDEIHVNAADRMQDIMAMYIEQGAVIIMFTATPIDIGHVADELIVACTNTEARECGALVKALHFGIDEPDTRKLKVPVGEDISENTLRKIMGAPKIVGRVIENYRRLNPEQKPTILFASGVSESLYFAEQFTRAGHRAAHIDGEHIWLDGEQYPTTPDLRQEVLDESKSGRISVVCNRFVLREGIDAPWLGHGIFATVYGSLQSYLQSGGRLLRNDGSNQAVSIQDHGGNWWRHGSLNSDREWRLDWSGTMIAAMREDRLRDGIDPEPFRCPVCAMILASRCCPCGFTIDTRRRSRPVMQLDGTLVELDGPIHRPKREYERPDGPTKWRAMVARSRTEKGSKTFRAAAALFAFESMKAGTGFAYPQRHWPMMPRRELDFYRLVKDVPMEELR